MYLVSEKKLERAFTHSDFPVLFLSIAVPRVTCTSLHAMKRINTYYAHMQKSLTRAAEKSLLKSAVSAFDISLELGKPFREFRAEQIFSAEESDGTLNVARTIRIRAFKSEAKETAYFDHWDADGWLIIPKRLRGAQPQSGL
jgi:hypothetical protein